MGLQWDGTRSKASPFKVEMHRRLWWNIRSFEHRRAEEHGVDPSTMSYASDTKLPLNINDADLDEDAMEVPKARTGCTDMTFCLVIFEITASIPWISHPPEHLAGYDELEYNSEIEMKEKVIDDCRNHLKLKYLQFCDGSRPLDWMTIIFAKLALVSQLLSGLSDIIC